MNSCAVLVPTFGPEVGPHRAVGGETARRRRPAHCRSSHFVAVRAPNASSTPRAPAVLRDAMDKITINGRDGPHQARPAGDIRNNTQG